MSPRADASGGETSGAHEITGIVANASLARAINDTLSAALARRFLRFGEPADPWQAFSRSLKAAAFDIERHERGLLVRRLVEFGPPHIDAPPTRTSNGLSELSDLELGSCIEFIYSHMVNRFKGELAELLALEPCCRLVERLQQQQRLSSGIRLHWGSTIRERRYRTRPTRYRRASWGGFAKGADGLLVSAESPSPGGAADVLAVEGAIEVKSAVRPARRARQQLDDHLKRLQGGVQLDGREWPRGRVRVVRQPVRVVVQPAAWKLDRNMRREVWSGQALRRAVFRPNAEPEVIMLPEASPPSDSAPVIECLPDYWVIELSWSEEALAQAAFEMTFWYMGEVGRRLHEQGRALPGRTAMTPEERGQNRIKEMLRSATLRPLREREVRRAEWLYNVYCYGYPTGSDSREMIFLPGEG